jgi:hypothetical protein
MQGPAGIGVQGPPGIGIPGPPGFTGPTGPTGPVGTLANLREVDQTSQGTAGVADQGASVFCDLGETLISCGYDIGALHNGQQVVVSGAGIRVHSFYRGPENPGVFGPSCTLRAFYDTVPTDPPLFFLQALCAK